MRIMFFSFRQSQDKIMKKKNINKSSSFLTVGERGVTAEIVRLLATYAKMNCVIATVESGRQQRHQASQAER